MSKTKKSMIVFIAAFCLLFGSMTAVFAGENIADLTASQKWKFSASYFGGVKKAYITSGTNYSDSKRAVYFINAVYPSASSAKTPSNYTQDSVVKVSVGAKCPKTPSSTFSSKKYFRLLLNPYGENTTGCRAHGVQRDYQ